MLLPRFAVVILVTAILSACAHGVTEQLPTAPGPTTVTLSRLSVTPQGLSLIAGGVVPITSSGNTLGLGALAQYSDGTAKYIEAAWTTSDPGVLAIEGTNIVAVSRGTATLTARAEGMTATQSFTVEPNVAGTWSGTYVVDQCAAGSGSMGELICSDAPGHKGILPVGTKAPITFEVQKNGNDLTATAALGEIRGMLRGTDLGSNFLTLKGDLTVNRTTVTVVHWNAHVKTDVMEAQIGFEVRIDNVPSHAVVVAHFDQVTRR